MAALFELAGIGRALASRVRGPHPRLRDPDRLALRARPGGERALELPDGAGEVRCARQVRVHVLAPDRGGARHVARQRLDELLDTAGDRARRDLAGELAEDQLGLRALELVAGGAGELGVDGGAEER